MLWIYYWFSFHFILVQTLRNAELKVAIKRSADIKVAYEIEAKEPNLYEINFTPDAIERHFVDVLLDNVVVSEGKSIGVWKNLKTAYSKKNLNL